MEFWYVKGLGKFCYNFFFYQIIETLMCYGTNQSSREVCESFVMNTTQIILKLLSCFRTWRVSQKKTIGLKFWYVFELSPEVVKCFDMNVTSLIFFIKLLKL